MKGIQYKFMYKHLIPIMATVRKWRGKICLAFLFRASLNTITLNDTACSSTLCGKKCLTTYMNSLDSIERGKLCKVKSCKVFTFGNNLKFQKGNTE